MNPRRAGQIDGLDSKGRRAFIPPVCRQGRHDDLVEAVRHGDIDLAGKIAGSVAQIGIADFFHVHHAVIIVVARRQVETDDSLVASLKMAELDLHPIGYGFVVGFQNHGFGIDSVRRIRPDRLLTSPGVAKPDAQAVGRQNKVLGVV